MKSASPQNSDSKKRKSTHTKFIPNLAQLGEASIELPDPELWPDETCRCPVKVDKKIKTIEFTRKKITRGKSRPYRWIYEGKVLIRNRDIPEPEDN
ncbi:MAG: hypothetical protein ACSHYA_19930 [Opitutaceae bacterium]